MNNDIVYIGEDSKEYDFKYSYHVDSKIKFYLLGSGRDLSPDEFFDCVRYSLKSIKDDKYDITIKDWIETDPAICEEIEKKILNPSRFAESMKRHFKRSEELTESLASLMKLKEETSK